MTKVLSIALAAALVGLPLPASQLLAAGVAPVSASAEARLVPATADFTLLLADPVSMDELSYTEPGSFLDLSKA